MDTKSPIDMTDEEYAKFLMTLADPDVNEETRSGSLFSGYNLDRKDEDDSNDLV